MQLPPGPPQGRLAQTVMLARDPLGVLRRLRDEYGPVFTARSTNGPMVVVGAAEERAAEMTRAARHLLRTPGNPPLPPPGGHQGFLGPAMTKLLERRLAPFAQLVRDAIEDRRRQNARGADGLLDRFAATDLAPQEVVEELTIIAAAATEAGDSVLTSVLERLAHRPDLAERFSSTGAADPLFGPVVDESLRLRPVAMASMRRLTRPVAIGGHDLPAGAVLIAPSLLLHRDPAHYPDPDAFRADRFAEGPYGPFFPFGGGERGCIGLHLALAEIRTVVPAVLRTRRLRPLARQPERLVERATILSPSRGALVVAS
jgi:cytochrome P450 family 135